jgi:hypothetical protein
VTLEELGAIPAIVVRVTDRIVGTTIELSAEQLIALATFQFSGRRMRTPNITTGQSFLALVRGLALS